MKAQEVDLYFYYILASALDGVGGQNHTPAALPRDRPGTHCTGGWVGPTAGLDGCGKYRPYRSLNPKHPMP